MEKVASKIVEFKKNYNDHRISSSKEKMLIRDFSFYYGEKKVIDSISLPIKENAITSLIGPSGCGKTTVLKSLNLLYKENPIAKAEGEVMFDGTNILNDSIDLIELRKRVGMVFQKPNPFPGSVYDNVVFGPRVFGVKKKSQLDWICEKALKEAALWDEVKNKLRGEATILSGGQQQRLCIARTIALEPEVILMDEPCSALDPISTLKIEDLMFNLKERYTLVVVTHNMQQAARISDYVAFLYAGEDLVAHLIEYDLASKIFVNPANTLTEKYIAGRIG